jgi:gamma-glutamyl-gamma-aminobutyrate hydrolase PuuD
VELPLLGAALALDMPVLGICRGMQALNVAMGGGLVRDLPGHSASETDGKEAAAFHHIYIAPGSKMAAIVGSGGFVKVNSLHHQGVIEAKKSPRLLASAYSVEDGVIEALESPDHDWVIGVQFHPERRMEVPPQFDRLFWGLVDRSRRRS